MAQKSVLCVLVTVCTINMILVFSNPETRTRKGFRIASMHNIYTMSELLNSKTTKSKSQCILSCADHVDCRAISYNITTGRCLSYFRNFTGQSFVSTSETGWSHYQISTDTCIVPTIYTTASDCSGVQSLGHTCNGVYKIHPTESVITNVYCDLNTDGGQWTVFQRRNDGSVDFHLNWMAYKAGFGSPSTECWIGNDILHQLTMSGMNELLILMENWKGVWRHARYSNFRIEDEGDNYRLELSGYSGTAGNSLFDQTGNQFSTKDRDNDIWSSRCNDEYHYGGWWFSNCGSADLNGYYYSSVVIKTNSSHWYWFSKARESLKTVWMMVRKNP